MGSAVAERPRILDEEDLLLSRPVHFIHHVSFEAPGAEEMILAPEPDPGVREGDTLGGGSAESLLPVRLVPLDDQRERHLFRKMNYLFFRAEELRQRASLRGFGDGEREEFCGLVV